MWTVTNVKKALEDFLHSTVDASAFAHGTLSVRAVRLHGLMNTVLQTVDQDFERSKLEHSDGRCWKSRGRCGEHRADGNLSTCFRRDTVYKSSMKSFLVQRAHFTASSPTDPHRYHSRTTAPTIKNLSFLAAQPHLTSPQCGRPFMFTIDMICAGTSTATIEIKEPDGFIILYRLRDKAHPCGGLYDVINELPTAVFLSKSSLAQKPLQKDCISG